MTTTRHAGCSTKQRPRPARSVTAPARCSLDTGTASSPTSPGTGTEPGEHYAVAVDAFIDLGTPVYEGIVLAGLGRCDEADGDTAAARDPIPGSAGSGSPARRAERHRVCPRGARTPRVRRGRPGHGHRAVRRSGRTSGNGSTGPHHRTNVPTLSTSSTRPEVDLGCTSRLGRASATSAKTSNGTRCESASCTRHESAVAIGGSAGSCTHACDLWVSACVPFTQPSRQLR